MVSDNSITIHHEGKYLSYEDACQLARRVIVEDGSALVCIDLRSASDAATAALAKLIALRRDLLKVGRDLRILGLGRRAGAVYEVHRMANLLPREPVATGSGDAIVERNCFMDSPSRLATAGVSRGGMSKTPASFQNMRRLGHLHPYWG